MAFMFTADQHRRLANLIRLHAGEPGAPSKADAEMMAVQHEAIAKSIDRYIAGGSIDDLFRSPSIIPD